MTKIKIFYLQLSFFFLTILASIPLKGQHSVRKMPYPINTDVYDEICPILSYEEDELFFTRAGSPDFNKTILEEGIDISEEWAYEKYQARLNFIYSQISGVEVNDPESSTFNQDIWFAHYHEGEIYNLFHPEHPLNNALPNSICSRYGKNDGYLVINQFGVLGGVRAGFSVVQKEDDHSFSFPEPIFIKDFDKTGSEVNASMSIDKEYIVLAMESGSGGKKDLFLSIKGYQGVYSPPMHLGNVINSIANEATPFFSHDKSKLYFSSDRPGGIGGMDIYVSDRLDFSFKNWSEPRLLNQPLNSPFNDSHPYIQEDENSIIFTSDRDGSSDIFVAKLIRDEALIHDIDINIFVVKDGERTPCQAEIMWSEAYKNDYNGFYRTKNGKYTYIFKENVPMHFKAQNRGLKSEVVLIDPQELQDMGIRSVEIEIVISKDINEKTTFKDIEFVKEEIINKGDSLSIIKSNGDDTPFREEEDLIALEKNSVVVLKNILFARAKPDVLPSSFPALTKLAITIKRRSDVVIQIEGHTDNIGDEQALIDLSLARANAIRDYLIRAGVPSFQVRTKGYGPFRPITKNRTEAERSKNRRVEIRILEKAG